jgi:CheY-like chemotaxis protein
MIAVPPILIVDDDRDLRETMAEALLEEGYEVATAADGLAAMQYLRSNAAPPLILLDRAMPRSDGAHFREMPRADAGLARIPVVLLTGAADGNRIAESEMGAVELLEKPVEVERLVEVVCRYAGAAPKRGRRPPASS